MTSSRIMCGAVVLSRELRRQADVAGTEGLPDNDRRRPHRPHRHPRRRMIQSGLIRNVLFIRYKTGGDKGVGDMRDNDDNPLS